MWENRIKSILRTLTLLMVLSVQHAHAQSLSRHSVKVKYLNADNLTRYDELEGNGLSNLYGDKSGNVWITTNVDLTRFDGYNFEIFYNDPNDSTSIAKTIKTSTVLEDQNGDVWIGAQGEIFRYRPKTNAFTSYDFNDLLDLTEGNHPRACVEDSFGNIFFGMYTINLDNPTMLYYDAKDEKLKKLVSPNGLELKNVFKLALGADNNIWALNHDGIFRIDENKVVHKVTDFPNYFMDNHENGGIGDPKDRLYNDMRNDSKGIIWLTTNKAELYSYDPTTRKLELHQLPSTSGFDIPNPITNISRIWGSMDFDKADNIYLSSYNGVLRYDPKTKTSWIFEQDKGTGEWPNGVSVDDFGNVWMAGLKGKFFRYNPKSLFKNIRLHNTTAFAVFDFFQHNDSTVLMSLVPQYYPTINHIDFRKEEIQEYARDTYFSGFSNVHIMGALEKGKYLFHSDQGAGVFENGLSHSIPSVYDSIPNPNWLKILKDSRENIWWYSKPGLDFYLQLKNDQEFRHFDLTILSSATVGRLKTNFIRTIYEGKNDKIWIITTNGLFAYDYKTDQIERYLYNIENGDVLLSQNIITIYEDDDHVLWIGTDRGGLSKYNLISKELKNYTNDDGLSSTIITGILSDNKRGDLWLSTWKGISKFNIKAETFVNFSGNAGIANNQFGRGSAFKTVDGYFVFGSARYLTYFRPEDFYTLSEAPKVYLTDLKIGDQSIHDIPEMAPKFMASTVQDLKLNYEQNSLSFEYKAIHFDDPEANQYAYKLENYDHDWHAAGSNRNAFYSNLPADEYAFSLKAANKYGIWSEPKIFANFAISPPWWATWWAYVLYFISGIALLFSIYRFQLHRNLDKAEARRLQELDTVKNRLYTNITHEFRTPLTVISGMTDQMEENPKEWYKEGLSMIRRNTNRLLELVNQMLDLTKLESGKTTLHNQQGDILTYLKYIVESIHSFAESKKIQVHFHEEGEELMMDFDLEKIQQIMINLLSNAVKFTPAHGHIYVHVRAVAEKDSPQIGSKLQIKVKNTGAGIPEDQLPYIFDRFYQVDDSTTRAGEGSGIGLALVKELVKLMKGEISVKSKVGKETEFTILLPISNVAPEGQVPVPSFKYEAVGLALANNNNNTSTNIEKEASETILEVTKPRVLLVEDNPDVVAYTASCLQGKYEIQVAKDGQEGIDIAIENIPDLIISDVMMPHKDGFEVCQTLKTDQRTSHIPIIMLTAKADMESKIEGLEKGADAYLAKPFHKQELLTRIKKLLELRANLQKHYLAIAGSGVRENNVGHTPEAPAIEDQFVQKLRAVVEAHLEDFDFTVEQFCKEVAMSHSQLHRKITALTGLSPNKFIRHVRLSKAKILLQNSELTVNAVAYETGFNDPGYFGRVFKKEFGVTPMEWKEGAKT